MHPLESLAALTEFAGNNIAHNLEFIPADRLAWKPAPTSKSALEIVRHTAGAFKSMEPLLSGGVFTPVEPPLPTDCASAQAQIRSVSRDYAAAIRAVDLSTLGNPIELPWGTMPLGQVLTFPVFDIMHHHGQIAYIQTLLGDDQDHFDM